ncbi:MAG TPA: hypothetical protein VF796_29340 [Humisphaera sp.]
MTRRPPLPLLSAVLVHLAAALPCAAGLSEPTVTFLRPYGGDLQSNATALDDTGMVIGRSYAAGGAGRTVGWRGTTGRPMRMAATSDPFAPNRLNNFGTMIGSAYPWGWSAAVFDESGTHPLFSPDYQYTPFADDLNDAGKIVGSARLSGGQRYAVAWTAEHQSRWLPDLSYGSRAEGINARGDVAGTVVDRDGRDHPAVWANDDALRVLPTPGWADGGSATGINAGGRVIGNVHSAGDVTTPVLWDHGVLQTLPLLPGSHAAFPADINNAGLTVGSAYNADGDPRAVLWENGQIRDLNDFVPAGSDWKLLWAWQVNERNQVIGWAERDGEQVGFLMSLPQSAGPQAVPLPPAAVAALLVGPLLWVARRRLTRSQVEG